ncbi:hypothetical protein AMATHDRAFT_9829 [Amanita thiersii Skay4041]|uniref:Uncharacterized protein n=1 Tax=Amanita thiersii Skay4041 TaxID=703135 RepID=A0A2A9NAA5_9AGAR|nr:hypothetical protein AMATHDRAFT_9829 [Amanita thiersii Skay4041]
MNREVINELCASADTTNQWLEQQIQLLHQEVTTLNTITTQLAPPPVIPIPPASPQPLPPLSPRYQPFQAWDDDRINWDNLEWKEDKYCGQVYHYAITGPDHARRFVGISQENQRCFANSKRQLARLIFEGQALTFTMSGLPHEHLVHRFKALPKTKSGLSLTYNPLTSLAGQSSIIEEAFDSRTMLPLRVADWSTFLPTVPLSGDGSMTPSTPSSIAASRHSLRGSAGYIIYDKGVRVGHFARPMVAASPFEAELQALDLAIAGARSLFHQRWTPASIPYNSRHLLFAPYLEIGSAARKTPFGVLSPSMQLDARYSTTRDWQISWNSGRRHMALKVGNRRFKPSLGSSRHVHIKSAGDDMPTFTRLVRAITVHAPIGGILFLGIWPFHEHLLGVRVVVSKNRPRNTSQCPAAA